MSQRRATPLSFLLTGLLLASAAVPAVAGRQPSPPDPDPNRGSIGVSVRGWSPGGADRLEAVEIWFVDADAGGGPYAATELIPSNYAGRDGRVYLLNAEPGRYAAVAFRTRGGSLLAVRDKQWVFFERKLIDATTVTVAPGALAFAGDYSVGGTPWRGRAEELSESNPYRADASQVHYLALLFPEAEGKSTLARIYGKNPVYLATLLERKTQRDAAAEAEFRRKALAKDFAEHAAWRTAMEAAR